MRRFAAVTSKARNDRYAVKAAAFVPYADRGMVRGAAVCDYNSCRDGPKFREFLTGFFARARAAKARGVVVDIRRNGGGNSKVNNELFAFVTNKPYRQYGGMRLRVSDRLKREYGREKYVERIRLRGVDSQGRRARSRIPTIRRARRAPSRTASRGRRTC